MSLQSDFDKLIQNKAFNQSVFGKYLGREIGKYLDDNGVQGKDIAEKIGKPQSLISNLLTGSRTTSNIDMYWQIASAGGMGRDMFYLIFSNAKDYENEVTTGRPSNKDDDLNILSDLDMDQEFIKDIALSTKGVNKDQLRKDLKTMWEFLKDKHGL